MAIENTYLLGKNITLGCGFDLQAKAPLDSRQTVPAFAGLQALIDNNAAYEGMIVYDEETKKTYQAQIVNDVLAFREFGINEAELKDLIASETTAAMEFKGVTATLPENPSKGDMYKVAGETINITIDGTAAKVGDAIVYNGEQWYLIPSGDDIEDTWRPVTGVDNDATLTFAAGDKLEKTVASDGTITYKHVAMDAPTNMNEEGDEQTRTYITQLITDNHGHVIGFKTATENVEDTNTTYTFEGQSDEATSVYFQVKSSEENADTEVIYLDTYSKNEADKKFVEAEDGKSLVDDEEITKLASVSEGANKVEESDTNGYIKIDGTKTLVYEHPTQGTSDLADAKKDNASLVKLLVDDLGHIAKANAVTKEDITALGIPGQDTVYVHPTHTAAASGLYKVTVDSEGHVAAVVAVSKEDITALGIPGQDTTYEKATANSDGLMSKEDFTKLDGVSSGANKVEAYTPTNADSYEAYINIDGTKTRIFSHPFQATQDIDDAVGNLNLFKINLDVYGHVKEVEYVDKTDLDALIGEATDTAAGLMSSDEHKTLVKLDGDENTAGSVANAKKTAVDTVVGTSADTESSDTVKGAKAYADARKAEIEAMLTWGSF